MSKSTEIVEDQGDFNDIMIKLIPFAVGKEPDDLVEQCLSLCQKYLAGIWTNLKVLDIDVKRLTSGMSNQTYLCKISNSLMSDEPKEVVIRMYGQMNRVDYKTWEFCDNKIEEGIVGLMASEFCIGPKIYGLFKTGQIMKYYPHRHFNMTDLRDKNIMEQMATNLAKFHAMKPPLTKNVSIEDFIKNNFRNFELKLDKKRELFKEFNLTSLMNSDLKSETDWLFEKVKSCESPIVFSHSDYRCGNTMVTEEKKVVLTDFEASFYYYRGYDFATLFNGFEKLDGSIYEFKDESVIKEFIAIYLKEGEKLNEEQYSYNIINSEEHILFEMKVFSMANFMFVVSIFINNECYELPLTEKTCLTTSEIEFNKYLAAKNLLNDI